MRVLLVVHTARPAAVDLARQAATRLAASGVDVVTMVEESADLGLEFESVRTAQGCDLVVVFGGDGTILRAAELAKPHGVAVLGVNMGRVGFLADAEPENLDAVVDAIVEGRLRPDDRVCVSVNVTSAEGDVWSSWGLNEVVIERHERERMATLNVSIDGRPLSQWSCDGVLCTTPTGSTAYSFSAGGPIVWPEVDAFLVVPSNAHALFSRPMVVAPTSVIDIDVVTGPVVVSCDGRRSIDVAAGATVRVSRDAQSVRFARVHATPFTERLVAKVQLPVQGWRGA
jgi:NAD+ kinase